MHIYSYFAFLFLIPFHDIPVAYFELDLREEKKLFTLEMEAGYLDYMEKGNASSVSIYQYEEYLDGHFNVEMNGQPITIELCTIDNMDNGHVLLQGDLPSGISQYGEMKIENTCFLRNQPLQINTVTFKRDHEPLRGFKMTKKRDYISIVL